MAVQWNPDCSQGQTGYDLRRLRLKGFIERIEHTNTYRVTARGTACHLLHQAGHPGRGPRPLRDAWRTYERGVDALVQSGLPRDPVRKLASNVQEDGRPLTVQRPSPPARGRSPNYPNRTEAREALAAFGARRDGPLKCDVRPPIFT